MVIGRDGKAAASAACAASSRPSAGRPARQAAASARRREKWFIALSPLLNVSGRAPADRGSLQPHAHIEHGRLAAIHRRQAARDGAFQLLRLAYRFAVAAEGLAHLLEV